MEDNIQVTTYENDIKKFIKQLKKKEIGFFDIPEEYRNDPDIVKIERKLGIRKSERRGYDIIHNTFFVEELILNKVSNEVVEKHIDSYFSTFVSYYEFLDGDIYQNSCYYQYNFSQFEIESYNLDLSKINTTALIDTTIKDFSIELSKEELKQYNKLEKDKTLRKKWIAKFNSCNTYKDFQKVITNFNKSKFSENDLIFFLFNFIFSDKDKAFDIIMQYVSSGVYPSYCIEKELCSIYDPQKVLASYNYTFGASSTIYRHKKRFKEYVNHLENKEIYFCQSSYFDENTHYFCQQITGYLSKTKQSFPIVKICRYFETFQELAEYLQNDLSSCDLSKAILPDIDFSVYKIDENTKLPIQNTNDLTYSLSKIYDRKKDCYVVQQSWLNSNEQIIKEHKNTFKYFFDFIFFLDNDLSDADLLFCDGLSNLHDFSNINLTNARLRSEVFDRIGTTYQLNNIDTTSIKNFPSIIKNEEETTLILTFQREFYRTKESIKNHKIYYISDLHLLHRIKNSHCKSRNDILYTIQKIIDNLINGIIHLNKIMILIGGDTSSNFELFMLFIQLLRKSLDENHLNFPVIFLLGNHELWEFPNSSFEEIVQKYETEIIRYKMYLLQNNIIYKCDNDQIYTITTNELLSANKENIKAKLKSARVILFGGLAFSGYNEEFNSNNGIYKSTIDRKQEIAESKIFENLYNIICNTLSDRNVIVFTHMPKKDWCSNSTIQSNFVYINGHTHRNYFYDDGEYRIYADNQIGYKHENPCFKYFYLEDEYDYFSEYSDGIYEITKEQYINFYRGKNIEMTFLRDINILYMLKKNGYYCFIHQSKNKQLTILNGGALKKLPINDINYYYERMNSIIAYIKSPLDKFMSIQKQIANEIKAIGGSGNIHGNIIDIDFFNHVYVNPYDLTLTSYFATDMIYKKVYQSIPELLKANCPALYENYIKLLKHKTKIPFAINDHINQELDITPDIYLATDIYKTSREIQKMQKLSSNILTTWYEPTQKIIK